MIYIGIDPGGSGTKSTTGVAFVRKVKQKYEHLWSASGTGIAVMNLVHDLELGGRALSFCSATVVVEDNTEVVQGKHQRRETNHRAASSLLRCQTLIEGICYGLDVPFLAVSPFAVRKMLGLPANATKDRVHKMSRSILGLRSMSAEEIYVLCAAHNVLRRDVEHELDAEAIALAGARLASAKPVRIRRR